MHGHVAHRVQFLPNTKAEQRVGTGTIPAGEGRPAITSLVLGSAGAWASFVCLMFSTIFLMKAWLLFSFLAMMISRTNHRALAAKQRPSLAQEQERPKRVQGSFRPHSLMSLSCSMSDTLM